MKYTLISTLVALTVVVAVGAQRCSSSADCQTDECCVAKRVINFIKGTCMKLSTEGESCNETDASRNVFGRKYFKYCPCTSDLSCIPTDEIFYPFVGNKKIDMRCRPADETSNGGELLTVD